MPIKQNAGFTVVDDTGCFDDLTVRVDCDGDLEFEQGYTLTIAKENIQEFIAALIAAVPKETPAKTSKAK